MAGKARNIVYEKKTDRRREKRAGRGRSGKRRDKEQSGKDNRGLYDSKAGEHLWRPIVTGGNQLPFCQIKPKAMSIYRAIT